MTTWKKFVTTLIVDYCEELGSRTFTLDELRDAKHADIISFRDASNKYPLEKLRQQLQFLRDDGVLSFEDNRGTYTLRRPVILRHEVDEDELADAGFVLDRTTPLTNRREYVYETFARERGWVRKAKDVYGDRCLIDKCSNRFKKPDGRYYIEVHHIRPLCEAGDDSLENLSVLCGHHHRAAHFADEEMRTSIRLFLEKIALQKTSRMF